MQSLLWPRAASSRSTYSRMKRLASSSMPTWALVASLPEGQHASTVLSLTCWVASN